MSEHLLLLRSSETCGCANAGTSAIHFVGGAGEKKGVWSWNWLQLNWECHIRINLKTGHALAINLIYYTDRNERLVNCVYLIILTPLLQFRQCINSRS